MIESHTSSPRIEDLQQRVADGILRAMARILEDMERGQALRERAWRVALCPKAACRRARGCRASGFGRPCEARRAG